MKVASDGVQGDAFGFGVRSKRRNLGAIIH